MKFFHYLWYFIRNVLRALLIIIIYLLIIWMIKNWWAVNYFNYLNSRDWGVLSSQINIFEPHTLTDVFYSTDEISWAMVSDWYDFDENNLTWVLVETWVIADTWVNVYDPDFQDDFDNTLDGQLSWDIDWSWNFGFVNTWV